MSLKTLLISLVVFAVIISAVDAHGSHSKRSNMPYGWRAKRDVQASTCSFMQCAVSGGNCGASGSSLQFCQAGEHCSGTTCVADLALGKSCSPTAQENECAQGTCVDINDGLGAVCRIYQEIMPGNPCTQDFECYFNQNADGSGSSASTCNKQTNTCTGRGVSEQCTASHQCLVGLFCSAGSCQPQGMSGASCSAESDCSSRFTCFNGKCSSRYSQKAGEQCSATVNCQSGLYCKAGTCASAKTSASSGSTCDIASNNCGADEQCACQGFQTNNQVATCSAVKGTYSDMATIESSAYSCMDKYGCGADTNNATTLSCLSKNCQKEYCTYFTRANNDLFTQYPSCLVSRMVENSEFFNLINVCKTFAPTEGNGGASTTGATSSASLLTVSVGLVAVIALALF